MLGFQYANATRLFFGREAEKSDVSPTTSVTRATSSSSTAEARSSARDCFPA